MDRTNKRVSRRRPGGGGVTEGSLGIGPDQPDGPGVTRFHRIVDCAPDPILVSEVEGLYVDANPAALALLGYERDELLALRTSDIVAPGPNWTEEEHARFLQDGSWQGEIVVTTKSGTRIPVEVRVVVLPEDDGGLVISYLRDVGERTRHEVTRARLASIVRSSADAIVGETLEGIITDWNPSAERLYGYVAKDTIGQHLSILTPPDRIHETGELLARVRRGESVEAFETVRRTKDGRLIDVSLTISPVWNDARQIIATSAIVRDISEKKAAERALAASELRFRTAFENAPIGMALIGPDRRFVRVNAAGCGMLGYTEEELRSKTIPEFTHPEDIELDVALAARAAAGERDRYEMEKRYLHKDGRIVWAHLSVSVVRDETGAPLYFISQIQDITERKEAEAELVATHQHTREVLERITDGFYAIDREWCFTYLNDAAERILQRSRDELLGRNIWEEFAPAVQTPVYDTYQQAMAEGRTTGGEFFYPPLAGWYEVRAYPSSNGLSVFFHDITHRKRVDEELRSALTAAHAANRATRQFLTMMSHELRTPMQAVMGYAELLLAGPEGSLTPEQTEDVQTIRRGATRLVHLVTQMLDLSRLEAGQIELQAEPVALAPIIEEVRRDMTSQAAAKGLALISALPAELPPVLGDEMGVHLILLNLVSNAVKFTEEGEVRISAQATDGEVAITVRDTGIGIAAEVLPHIFEEFRQAEGGMTRRYEGAGLGLTIARLFAELMGGRITVESQLGHGSTFTLRLVPSDPGSSPRLTPPFTVEVVSHPANVAVIRLTGPLDRMSAPWASDQIAAAVAEGHRTLILDVGAVPFVDGAGMTTFVNGMRRAWEAGGELRIAAPTDRVKERLLLMSLDQALPIHATVEDALADVS